MFPPIRRTRQPVQRASRTGRFTFRNVMLVKKSTKSRSRPETCYRRGKPYCKERPRPLVNSVYPIPEHDVVVLLQRHVGPPAQCLKSHVLVYTGLGLQDLLQEPERSEERRVGKECRSRWSPYH